MFNFHQKTLGHLAQKSCDVTSYKKIRHVGIEVYQFAAAIFGGGDSTRGNED